MAPVSFLNDMSSATPSQTYRVFALRLKVFEEYNRP